ncbi:Sugar phosphate permease [Albimonas donghaensis]|uniref:Sugar phosphate permease n=1 Tax=Albimonas donghaensis TaxID=356660 RepID=A0A1H2YVV4_9RHOB|nr:MFS transporter [Albimonas donghaensis]SDX09312.1 Sugar phosphate permease [Albimonas donghaensis]
MPGIIALGLSYVFSQFYRSCLAVLAPYMTDDLGLNAADLGMASGAWFLVFAVMQLPVGVGLDRIGPRLTGGVLFGVGGAGGAAVFAIADGPVGVTIAMALMGAGCAPALMSMFYIFARNFSMARFATLSSITVGLGTLGNIAGTAPFAMLVEAMGWRESMVAFALISAAISAAALVLVQDPPRVETQAGERADRGFLEYLELMKMRVYWPIIPLAMINYAPAAGIRGLWAGPYLVEVFGADAAAVGRATLWMAIAMSIGAFIYGPLDRIFGTRKWVILVGNTLAVGACALIGVLPDVSFQVSVLLIMAIGALAATYTVVMAHARALAPLRLVGRAVTLMNFFVMLGVGLFQGLTGEVIEAGRHASGAVAAYGHLFLLYAVALAGALAIYLFSQDAKP